MLFVVQKNHFSSRRSRRRSVNILLHVFPLVVLIFSSLITFVICSNSGSSRRHIRTVFGNEEDNPSDFLKIRVLHTNDLHSRFDEVTISGSKCKDKDRKLHKCYGGVARLKYMVDSIRNEHKPDDNILFLNAGDFFQVCKISFL